jgi:hypothetical protein
MKTKRSIKRHCRAEPVADSAMPAAASTVAVVYADAATVRSRLVGVAQQVRALLAGGRHPLPTLALPRRARYGFWHMGFDSEEAYAAAEQALLARPFVSDCGCFSGRLAFEREQSEFESVAAIATCSLELGPEALSRAGEWLAERFGEHGQVLSSHVPRLGRSNWDPGVGTVTLSDPDTAARAVARLDGTPSFVVGDNLAARLHQPYRAPADSYAAAAPLIEQSRLLRIECPVGT